ncbi:hypothetical protein SDC9_198658 [bioreactor metagenome]|uniref:Uncharacterized protein n=1 Tax=bioreactor metagenome TaxID=1076179 RepID=A0A645II89_9ZZZZ
MAGSPILTEDRSPLNQELPVFLIIGAMEVNGLDERGAGAFERNRLDRLAHTGLQEERGLISTEHCLKAFDGLSYFGGGPWTFDQEWNFPPGIIVKPQVLERGTGLVVGMDGDADFGQPSHRHIKGLHGFPFGGQGRRGQPKTGAENNGNKEETMD